VQDWWCCFALNARNGQIHSANGEGGIETPSRVQFSLAGNPGIIIILLALLGWQ